MSSSSSHGSGSISKYFSETITWHVEHASDASLERDVRVRLPQPVAEVEQVVAHLPRHLPPRAVARHDVQPHHLVGR
eukprot:CAMPEP_0205876118 /NCGR_PEP_ID=MMETSP1083-20121108/13622_1 /ASSEMBLY_ACC=CAM_ASM_000430 /TAXON_ID=97485 /ORGANISM="Prymnesium parvum, Strain Texoma1" /LENGTH=76 /DNA_ID=CAMNT_0053238847 /DNA_START=295 /DNA_END=522 /DNA_ORIENTATION=-